MTRPVAPIRAGFRDALTRGDAKFLEKFQVLVKVEGLGVDGTRVKRSARLFLSALTAVTCVSVVVDPGVVRAAPSPSTGAATPGPTTAYTVKDGDSLVGIANRFGIKVSALLRANDLTLSSVIFAGDVLTVPAAAPPGTPSPTDATAAAPLTSTRSYVVVPGDALAGIARAHGVTLGALVKANGLTTASVIHPGRTLQVPPATLPIPEPAAASTPAAAPTTAAAPAVATPAAAPSGSKVDVVLGYARSQIGKPYRFFAAGPDAFDCSGLVVAAYREAGVSLVHQSKALSTVGTPVDWTTEPILPGDLVLTASTGAPTVISHVGIALDDATWIQAVGAGRTVSIGRLPVDSKILAVRRVL